MIKKVYIPNKAKTFEIIRTVYSHSTAGNSDEPIDLEMDIIVPQYHSFPSYNQKHPLILWIPTGGWTECNPLKWMPNLLFFAERGYTAASIQYRLSAQAHYPAQVTDVKTAIRFLRMNAEKYGIDPDRIGVMGASAGGYLAAMAAMNNDQHDEDEWKGISSRVSAAVVLCAPTDLSSVLAENTENGFDSTVKSGTLQFLGDTKQKGNETARAASPVFQINPGTCPVLIAHGTDDRTIPVSQGESFYHTLKKSGIDAELYLLDGAGHLTPEFAQEEFKNIIHGFFDRHLV